MDHKESLLKLLNELKICSDFILQGKIFKKFDLTIKVIFKKEEERYLQYDHPDLWIHKKIHDEFIRTLTSFSYQYFLTRLNRTQEFFATMLEFLFLWIEDHLIMDDSMQSYIGIEDFIKGI